MGHGTATLHAPAATCPPSGHTQDHPCTSEKDICSLTTMVHSREINGAPVLAAWGLHKVQARHSASTHTPATLPALAKPTSRATANCFTQLFMSACTQQRAQ
jgi:hypothetical protein